MRFLNVIVKWNVGSKQKSKHSAHRYCWLKKNMVQQNLFNLALTNVFDDWMWEKRFCGNTFNTGMPFPLNDVCLTSSYSSWCSTDPACHNNEPCDWSSLAAAASIESTQSSESDSCTKLAEGKLHPHASAQWDWHLILQVRVKRGI